MKYSIGDRVKIKNLTDWDWESKKYYEGKEGFIVKVHREGLYPYEVDIPVDGTSDLYSIWLEEELEKVE